MVSDKKLEKVYPKEKKWIQGAIKNPGGLHRALGIAEDKKIPAGQLKVKPTDSSRMKRMKNLAKTLKKF